MRHHRATVGLLATAVLLASTAGARPVLAQDTATVHWRRSSGPTEAPITVFHSTQSANLPTAATRKKGELIFEISHRFEPPFSSGQSALWGLDGPIWNRLGLTFSVTDRVLVGIRRTNLNDNLDVNAKVRFMEGGRGTVPYQLALNGGVAWNTQAPEGPGYKSNEMQAYAQLVADARLGDKVVVGVVPTLLHNPRIADVTAANEFVLGMHGNVYLTDNLSLLGEWVAAPAREGLRYDPVTFGFQIETGGHFFKILATNSTRPNPSQQLAGTPYPLTLHNLRFGFNVTRLIAF